MTQMAASASDPLELKENPEADPFSVAKNIALRQLSLAPKTRFQLEQALAKKGVDTEIAKASLDRLTEVGLIDDLAYAGMFVRSKCVAKKISRSVLRMELRQKGVSDEHIEEALLQVTDDDEYRMASELVVKKLRSMAGIEKAVIERRLYGLLARKGYHSGVVLRVIKEQLSEFSADQELADFA